MDEKTSRVKFRNPDVKKEIPGSKIRKACAERDARGILREGKAAPGLTDEMIRHPKQLRGDLRRSVIAWAIWTKTSGVTQQWIADALNLRSAPNVCQQVQRFSAMPRKPLPNEIHD